MANYQLSFFSLLFTSVSCLLLQNGGGGIQLIPLGAAGVRGPGIPRGVAIIGIKGGNLDDDYEEYKESSRRGGYRSHYGHAGRDDIDPDDSKEWYGYGKEKPQYPYHNRPLPPYNGGGHAGYGDYNRPTPSSTPTPPPSTPTPTSTPRPVQTPSVNHQDNKPDEKGRMHDISRSKPKDCDMDSFWDTGSSSCKQNTSKEHQCGFDSFWDDQTSKCKNNPPKSSQLPDITTTTTTTTLPSPSSTHGCGTHSFWDTITSSCKDSSGRNIIPTNANIPNIPNLPNNHNSNHEGPGNQAGGLFPPTQTDAYNDWGVSSTLSSSSAVYTVTVDSGALTFTPANLTINQGDRVVWKFTGNRHSVTEASNSTTCEKKEDGFDSGVKTSAQDETFTRTFPEMGTFYYMCSVSNHCANGMRGEILVNQVSLATMTTVSAMTLVVVGLLQLL